MKIWSTLADMAVASGFAKLVAKPFTRVVQLALAQRDGTELFSRSWLFRTLRFYLGRTQKRPHEGAFRYLDRDRSAIDRKSTRLNSSNYCASRMPSSA